MFEGRVYVPRMPAFHLSREQIYQPGANRAARVRGACTAQRRTAAPLGRAQATRAAPGRRRAPPARARPRARGPRQGSHGDGGDDYGHL